MLKILRFLLLFISFSSCFAVIAESQVPVEVSQVVEQYNGKNYYLHTVESKQTIYAISRAYQVTPESILISNPAARHGIRINQVLRIPVGTMTNQTEAKKIPENDNQPPILKEYDYIYHVSTNNDRFSYIADIYLVSESSIRQANPNLTEPINGGVYVKVPISLKDKNPLVAESEFKRNNYDPYVDPSPNKEGKGSNRLEAVQASQPDKVQMVNPFENQNKNVVPEPKKVKPEEPSKPDVKRHVVKPKETVYSVAKSYNLSIEALQKANPGIEKGLISGQVLFIPEITSVQTNTAASSEAKVGNKPENEKVIAVYSSEKDSIIRYTVKKSETLYSLARNNAVSIDELKKLNPGLTESIKVGQIILIPKKKIESPFISHEVSREQKTSQLAKDFGISVDRLERTNPGIGSKVFPGQIVKIPIADNLRPTTLSLDTKNETESIDNEQYENENSSQKTDLLIHASGSKEQFHISLLLPLYLEKADSLTYSSNVNPTTFEALQPFQFIQFYEGFLIAVDSLAKVQGLKVELSVFDIDQDQAKLTKVLKDPQLAKSDLIIGPFFASAFEKVAAFALEHQIPIVNPMSPRQEIVKNNPYVIKVKPGEQFQYEQITKFVRSYYPNAKVFLFRANSSKFKSESTLLQTELNRVIPETVRIANSDIMDVITKRSLMRRMPENEYVSSVMIDGQKLNTHDIQNSIFDSTAFTNPITEFFYSADSIRSFSKKASVVRPNVVIAFADDNVFAMEFVNKINQVTDTFNVKMIGIPAWDRFTNLFIDPLVKMNTTFVEPNRINYTATEVLIFRTQFRNRFGFEPELYAYEGFDIGYYFLESLMKFGNDIPDGITHYGKKMLQTQYYFARPLSSDGIENRYWNFGRHADYQYVPLKNTFFNE
jgi:LysM repeat protein